ncbi:MAG: hypothetical protein ACJ748_05690, partial [Flavisolibacter sp.]
NSILIMILFSTVVVHAQQKQSLKDLLYSGKLKKDSTGVIRSTDDLSAKIDTSTKKNVDTLKLATMTTNQDKKTVNASTDNAPANVAAASVVKDSSAITNQNSTVNTDNTNAITPANSTSIATSGKGPIAGKTNTKIWREYSDSLNKTLKEEVLRSKQIKKDTYYLLVEYEIAPDGLVTIDNITSTPENKFLQAQVKQIMDSTPLYLNPVTDSGGQARKVKRRQQIVVTKE